MCRKWTHLCTSNTSFPAVCQPCCVFLWPLCGPRSGSQLITGGRNSPAFCQLSGCHHCQPQWSPVWRQLCCYQLWLWGRTCSCQHSTSDRAISAFCQLSGCHHCQPRWRLVWGQLSSPGRTPTSFCRLWLHWHSKCGGWLSSCGRTPASFCRLCCPQPHRCVPGSKALIVNCAGGALAACMSLTQEHVGMWPSILGIWHPVLQWSLG